MLSCSDKYDSRLQGDLSAAAPRLQRILDHAIAQRRQTANRDKRSREDEQDPGRVRFLNSCHSVFADPLDLVWHCASEQSFLASYAVFNLAATRLC